MSKSYKETLKQQLKNPEFQSEFEALEPEFQIIQAILDARIQKELTQKDLSAATGITQSDISKLENGTRNPSLKLLKRLADGMDMTLRIEFIPKKNSIGAK